jgi:hypothetical protein
MFKKTLKMTCNKLVKDLLFAPRITLNKEKALK